MSRQRHRISQNRKAVASGALVGLPTCPSKICKQQFTFGKRKKDWDWSCKGNLGDNWMVQSLLCQRRRRSQTHRNVKPAAATQ
jgi:hypothetical protein